MRNKKPKERNDKPIGFFPTQREDDEPIPQNYSSEETEKQAENAEEAEEAAAMDSFDPAKELTIDAEEPTAVEAPAEIEIAPAEDAAIPDEIAAPETAPEIVAPEETIAPDVAAPEETIAPEVAAAEETPEVAAAEETTPKAPAEDTETREYGAPQPLFEDIIPAGFSFEEKQKEHEKEKARLAAIKKAEAEEKRRQKEWEEGEKRRQKEEEEAEKRRQKEEAAAAKKQAKSDKKKAKTAALIASVEQKAVSDAEKDIKRETGEDYSYEEPKQPEAPKKKKPNPAEDLFAADDALAPERHYSKGERKLRKKYKMDRDNLLSENDVVPGFVIAKGENVVRTYNCLSAKGGDGTICLTNKRLLINAGERSEVALDQVSGIKFSNFTHFKFFKFLFGLIFLALGALLIALPFIKDSVSIPFVTGSHYKSWFPYLFYPCGGISAIIGLPLLFTSIKTTFYFCVFARVDAPFLEYKSAAQAKREKKGKVFKFSIAKPGKESDKAARELGALILEIKQGRYDN